MANIFEFAKANPLKVLWQTDKMAADSGTPYYQGSNPSFNQVNQDDVFYYNAIRYYEVKVGYVQPYQQSDTIFIQFLSSDTTTANFSARLLDINGSVVTKTVTITQQSGTYNGLKLYTTNVKLYDVAEGIYFLQLVNNGGGTQNLYLISEPFDVKQTHRNTIRIDYRNSFNDQSMIWYSATETPQIRVKGAITEVMPEAKFNVYEDQPLNLEMVSGIAYRSFTLNISYGSIGIPEWLVDKLNRIFLCDTLKVDGKAFTREESSKFEGKEIATFPLREYTLKLRERYNYDTYNVPLRSMIVGDMPMTSQFWIEAITLHGVATNVRLGFSGYKNFLDYLNSTLLLSFGYWAMDNKNQIIFIYYEGQVSGGSVQLSAANVLPYCFKISVLGAGDLDVDITSGGAGKFYAIVYGTATTTVNKTSLPHPTTLNVSETFAVATTCYIYTSDCTVLEDASTTIPFEIGGDLPINFVYMGWGINTDILKGLTNNIFNFVSSLEYFDATNQNIPTKNINEIIMWLYDARLRLDALCEIYLNGQTPSASPPSDILALKGYVSSLITTFTTD